MKIHRVKQVGLLFSGLAFLGGLEIATYAGSPQSQQTLKAQHDPQSIATPDEVFLESSEERDFETGYEFLGLSAYRELLKPDLLQSFLGLEKFRYNSSLISRAQNSRAPPII